MRFDCPLWTATLASCAVSLALMAAGRAESEGSVEATVEQCEVSVLPDS